MLTNFTRPKTFKFRKIYSRLSYDICQPHTIWIIRTYRRIPSLQWILFVSDTATIPPLPIHFVYEQAISNHYLTTSNGNKMSLWDSSSFFPSNLQLKVRLLKVFYRRAILIPSNVRHQEHPRLGYNSSLGKQRISNSRNIIIKYY